MGLFSWLKKKGDITKKYIRLESQNLFDPIYSQYGQNVYVYDVVQQALNCIVREIKKLRFHHIGRGDDGQTIALKDIVQNVLENPNVLMTQTDFLEKIIWQLFFNYNSFILPVWDMAGNITGLFPLQPVQVDFQQDSSGEIYVHFAFANSFETTVRYKDIIHLRYNYSVSEFMGGNELGQPDNRALVKVVNMNNELITGVAKAMKAGYAINGILKYNTLIDNGKAQENLNSLIERLEKSESGLMPIDLKADFTQFKRDIQLVDDKTLKFVDEKILRHFGVPLPILTGDYTKAQYEAFYQKTIEPIVITISQAFTKALFSNRQQFGFGHAIILSHNLLDFMSMDEKIRFVTIASNIGGITVDEFRTIFGFAPFGGDLGSTPIMSKNYGNAQVVKDIDNSAD